jgi:glycerophosphoryl diester phosphodiesterase
MITYLTTIYLLLMIKDGPTYSKPPICIAHRGASAYAPEHTLAAYRLALDMKADFVEPDLQITKDGVLICMHDTTLERTTNIKTIFPERCREVKGRKQWLVSDFTLNEIKQLDAGNWFHAKFAGEKVPTLQEMIDVVKGHAGIIPETKSPESYEQSGLIMEKLLMELLRKNGLDRRGTDTNTPVIIQSFSLKSLQKMRNEYNCELPLLLLYTRADKETFSPDNLKKLKLEVDGVGPNKGIVLQQPEMVKACHNAGLSVTIYTCRSRNADQLAEVNTEMKKFLGMGVDAIFTDNPDQFPRPAK